MKILLIIFLFLIGNNLFSQNEGNIWYFGQNAGIDFNSGAPVSLSNGALNSVEGCATICDNSGNLLFYTDGVTVYNSNHQPMANGTGLMGDQSSTQSAIIVKKPGNANVYSILTTDQGLINSSNNGVRYSEVDMSLQGGLGDVTSTVNSLIYLPSSEKITAVKHQNNVDYWIVTTDPTLATFQSFLLTSAGISMVPILSTTLSFPQNSFGGGYLKANSIGTKMATAGFGLNNVGTILFDFNNATGVLSNPITVHIGLSYGVEFSPSGQYLYIAPSIGASVADVLQYDTQAGVSGAIINSQSNIGSIPTPITGIPGAMQLAPDFKIYITTSSSNTLSVINNPDLQGTASGLVSNGFSLASGTSSNFGLPNFFNDIVKPSRFYEFGICQGDSIELSDPSFQHHNWAFRGSPLVVFSNDSLITVSPSSTSEYILFDGPDTSFFNVTVQVPPAVDLGPDFAICPSLGSDTTLYNLNSAIIGATYLWQNGSINDSLTLNLTGDYWLQVTDSIGCVGLDTVTISNLAGINIEITVGNPACHDESNGSIVMNTTGSAANITFTIKDSQGSILNTPVSNIAIDLSAGYYFVDYSDGSCTATDSIVLINPPKVTVDVSITNPLCYGDSTGTATEVNLSGYQGELDSVFYSWTPNPQLNNGLLVDSIWSLHARAYNLEVVDYFGCTGSVDFDIVDPPKLSAIFSEPILPFCRLSADQTGAGIVSASADPNAPGTGSTTFQWTHLSSGQTSNVPTFSGIREPGTIELTLTDANGCKFTDQIYLDSINPVADFDVQSDQFDLPDIYEGTEDVKVKITNLSTGFVQPNDPNDDVVFLWNLYTNQYPESEQNWFFTFNLGDNVDTTYKGEEVYQVCLVAKNYNDCADTTCKEITVHITPKLIVPNVFTPGASPNQTFFFPNDGIKDFECTVFNRYGVKVYEFNDILDQWDGNHYLTSKPCSDAVYYYTYTALSTNNTAYKGEGEVTLLGNK